MKVYLILTTFLFSIRIFSEEIPPDTTSSESSSFEPEPVESKPNEFDQEIGDFEAVQFEKPEAQAIKKKWYFDLKPGYYYLTDRSLREIYGNGGFTFRAEAGYQLWGPLTLWFDGGYFQKDGCAVGGYESTKIMIGSLTLGLKLITYLHERIAFYAGAGPRLFLVKIHNDSPYVRGEDNAFGIGGGFNGGFWFFPVPFWPNFFFDLFADYSWKNLKFDEDEVSSYDYDVDVSGITAGLGIGFRF